MTIGSVRGSGAASPAAGTTVEIEGVVTGDFQVGGFDGYMQDFGDGDPATSDGIFVYAQGGAEVAVGDAVHVKGVSEYFELTEITPTAVEVCATGAESPAPVELTLPIDPAAREPLEGMRVAFREPLTIIEYFEHAQYGQIVLGKGRQYQPTATFEPGSPEAVALAEKNAAERITLDDGRSQQNPDPASHPNGQPFTLDNRFRGGDLVSNVIGVLDYRFAEWAIQPTQAADHVAANPRTDVPEVAGGTTVASFNVLNYFTTLGSRGADTQAEFERQQAKIVSAITEIDADIVGLIEIENDGDAVEDLVDALNAKLGAEAYAAVPTGVLGTDEITTFIYQPAGSSRSESSPFSTRRSTRASATRNRPRSPRRSPTSRPAATSPSP